MSGDEFYDDEVTSGRSADTPDPRPAPDDVETGEIDPAVWKDKPVSRWPDPRPVSPPSDGESWPEGTYVSEFAARPVSPPSELTAEEVRATNALFEAMREAGLFGRRRQAVEDAAHHLAAVARAGARAAPQTDANLEGYWERAYWEIVPKLQAALDAAPQADAGTLREVRDQIAALRPAPNLQGSPVNAYCTARDDAFVIVDAVLAAWSA